MSDLDRCPIEGIGAGETRVYFLPSVRDPAAPTPAELEAGTDLGPMLASAPDITMCDEPQQPFPRESFLETTFTIRLNITVYRREIRRLIRRFRRLERAMQRSDPRYRAMRADYARRRKARRRRR